MMESRMENLVMEDTIGLASYQGIKAAISKVRAIVEFLKHLQYFIQIQKDLGMVPITPIVGTHNRWFFNFHDTGQVIVPLG